MIFILIKGTQKFKFCCDYKQIMDTLWNINLHNSYRDCSQLAKYFAKELKSVYTNRNFWETIETSISQQDYNVVVIDKKVRE